MEKMNEKQPGYCRLTDSELVLVPTRSAMWDQHLPCQGFSCIRQLHCLVAQIPKPTAKATPTTSPNGCSNLTTTGLASALHHRRLEHCDLIWPIWSS